MRSPQALLTLALAPAIQIGARVAPTSTHGSRRFLRVGAEPEREWRNMPSASIMGKLPDGAQCSPEESCMICASEVSILAGDGVHRYGMEMVDGTNCNPSTSCFLCENGGRYRPLADEHRCGTEPSLVLEDGTPCNLASSCDNCDDEASFWATYQQYRCGTELTDGEPCDPYSTCYNCLHGSVTTLDGYRCGSTLADGTNCNPSTTCFICENGGNYWPLADEYRCGTEPALELEDGEPCNPSSTCQNCENGSVLSSNGYRCGEELEDGTYCNPSTTCFLCANEGTIWPLADEYRCGTGPPLELADGEPCAPETSCAHCENWATYWDSAQQYRCGTEPSQPDITANVLDPVLVCVPSGSTPRSDYAWSIREGSENGDYVTQLGAGDGDCQIVDLYTNQPYFFRIFDRSGRGEVYVTIFNNDQEIFRINSNNIGFATTATPFSIN